MRIALLGDIALFGECTDSAYFKEISEYLSGFDYVVGNLETPFSIKKKTNGAKSAYICSDVENVAILKQLHIHAVTLANNHMFDFGKEGYETTKRILTENGIRYFGTEGKEVYAEILGNKIAFSGFCCYTSNPLRCVPYGEYGVNAYSIPSALHVLKTNTNNGFFNIMAVHAGLEHVNYPSLEHIKAARLLAKEQPFVYYGHHPHVIQGIEEYKDSLIAYSLGNFCFDDIFSGNDKEPFVALTENNRQGIILEIEINEKRIVSWKEQPVYISSKEGIKLFKVDNSLDGFNKRLKNCLVDSQSYESLRNDILLNRTLERKSRRDIKWYIKRLKPRYFMIIMNAWKNKKLYKKNVLDFINMLCQD